MALRWFCWERCKAAPTILNIVKNALGLFAQGENVSAVPPVFRVWLCTLSVLIYCVPVTWNWRWSLLGMSVQVLWIRRDMRFGSLLGGYFHNSFTKARTDRFLSVLPGVVYSSLSWHLADIGIFIVRIGGQMFSWVTLYIWREEIVNRVLDNCYKIYVLEWILATLLRTEWTVM